jgi:predicted RecB family nuclease
MNKIISTAILVAKSQCPRKAYLLLWTKQKGKSHEYVRILQQQKIANQRQYIKALKQKNSDVQFYAEKGLKNRCDFLVGATLRAYGLEADCDLLVKVKGNSSLGRYSYEPTIFVGTHTVTKEQRLQVMFAGYVLAHIQKKLPATGRIIRMESRSTKVKLEGGGKTLIPILEPLQEWVNDVSLEAPPVILNNHCSLCQFRSACRAKAEQEDNLSLLDKVTPKVMRRYEKKGIFTIKQLSYLYKPRKRRKRARNTLKPTHKIELQALAIRTEKIYLQELPVLTRQPVELFLDIEGVPDRGVYYLIGLLVCEGDKSTHYSFWADSDQEEEQMWLQFLEKAKQYADTPIYHYGSYEPRAIAKLARRYETDSEGLIKRLVNVNSHIYGNVYFPVYSNSLKTISEFIGATWTSPDASGLQSLVWRHYWNETHNAKYQELLTTYNEEDCRAMNLLTDELSRLKRSANTRIEVDFADKRKLPVTDSAQQIHSQFGMLLRSAHFSYDKKKISFRQEKVSQEKRKRGGQAGKRTPRSLSIKPMKSVVVAPGEVCPKCGHTGLKPSKLAVRRLIIDLVLMKNGIKKTIIEYIGNRDYCYGCKKLSTPPGIRKYERQQLYGRGLKAWLIYHRIALRLPYESVLESLEEHFNERISAGRFVSYVAEFADYYTDTEKIIAKKLLKSPFIHVDETKFSIKGSSWYVWVFTNSEQVIFKLTETRETDLVHEFLADYCGVLISDFYPGYDSVKCLQQKCWVHLIRNLNDDLRENPFNDEYEAFIMEVRSLIVPIMETIQKYGLKKRNLNKFKKVVGKFYRQVIIDKHYKTDLTLKYQKRFLRYRESLFTFLEQDGIPWHNNTAERGVRPVAKQRAISTAFGESTARDYLLLLGIRQTCRFQGKSFFKFLFSGETDIDQFQRSKRSRKV